MDHSKSFSYKDLSLPPNTDISFHTEEVKDLADELEKEAQEKAQKKYEESLDGYLGIKRQNKLSKEKKQPQEKIPQEQLLKEIVEKVESECHKEPGPEPEFCRKLFPENIRKQIAHDIYVNNPRGSVIFVLKTTRVGCTTNLVAAAKDLGLSVFIIEPINSIGELTITGEVPQFCEVKPEITTLLANQHCYYNKLRVARNKDVAEVHQALNRLPIVALPRDCRDCRTFFEAECSEIEKGKTTACLTCYGEGKCKGLFKIDECRTCEKVPAPCQGCEDKRCIAWDRCKANEILKKPIRKSEPKSDIVVGTAQKISILTQRYLSIQESKRIKLMQFGKRRKALLEIIKEITEFAEKEIEKVKPDKQEELEYQLNEIYLSIPETESLDLWIQDKGAIISIVNSIISLLNALKSKRNMVVTWKHELNEMIEWLYKQEDDKPSLVEEILRSLDADVVIFDEMHLIQFMELVIFNIQRINLRNGNTEETLDLSKYDPIVTAEKEDSEETDNKLKYPCLSEIISRYKKIREDSLFNLAIDRATEAAKSPDYLYRHIKEVIVSPVIEELDDSQVRLMGGMLSELVNLIESKDFIKFDLDFDNYVIPLYQLATIATSKKLAISAIRSNKDISIVIAAADMSKTEMLNEFSKMLQWDKKRYIIFTSATFDETLFSFNDMLHGNNKVEYIFYGDNGDPLNTNAKSLILASTHRRSVYVGRDSLVNDIKAVVKDIIPILNKYEDKDTCKWDKEKRSYGEGNVKIIAANMELARKYTFELKKQGFPHKVTYYKASDTMGVKFDGRLTIAIGLAWKPSNSFDIITNSREESDLLNLISMQADAWQGWARGKDGNGIVPSAVVVFGANKNDCEGVVTWGKKRKVEIIKETVKKVNKDGREYDVIKSKEHKVTCEEYLSKPRVTSWKNTGQLLHQLHMHLAVEACVDNPIYHRNPEKKPIAVNLETQSLDSFLKNCRLPENIYECEVSKSQEQEVQCKYSLPDIKGKLPVLTNYSTNNIQGSFVNISGKGYKRSDVIRILVTTSNAVNFAKTSLENFRLAKNITECTNPIPINTRTQDGNTEIVAFCKIQKDKTHILSEELTNVPFISEIEPDGSENIYIILNRVSATKVKQWARSLIKSIGVKCQVYPNSISNHNGKVETILINPNSSFFIHNYTNHFNVSFEWLADPQRLMEIAEERDLDLEAAYTDGMKEEDLGYYSGEITEDDEQAYTDACNSEQTELEELQKVLEEYNEQIRRECAEALMGN